MNTIYKGFITEYFPASAQEGDKLERLQSRLERSVTTYLSPQKRLFGNDCLCNCIFELQSKIELEVKKIIDAYPASSAEDAENFARVLLLRLEDNSVILTPKLSSIIDLKVKQV